MCKLIVFLVLAGCSASIPTACSTNLVQKKDILGNVDMTTHCDCACPRPSGSLLSSIGIIGGLFNATN